MFRVQRNPTFLRGLGMPLTGGMINASGKEKRVVRNYLRCLLFGNQLECGRLLRLTTIALPIRSVDRWVTPSALPNLREIGFANLLAKVSALKNPKRNGTLIKGNDIFVKLKGWFCGLQFITGNL